MISRRRKKLRRTAAIVMMVVFLTGTLPAPAQLVPPRTPTPPAAPRSPVPPPPMGAAMQPSVDEQPEPVTSSDIPPFVRADVEDTHPLLSKEVSERLISVNFRDAPLDQVLTFYSELVGRTLLKSPGINATITLRGTTRLTTKEALEAIESVLAMNNVALLPMGDRFLKVVQPTAVRQEGMPIQMALPEKPFPETDQLVSQIITLRFIEMAEAQTVIQGFLHGYGKIQPLERANSLLITETAINLQRILDILQLIDQPTEARVETRIYELKYAEAGKIAGRLNELIQDSQARDERPQVAVPVQPTPTQPVPPGVIRAQRTAPPRGVPEPQTELDAALAERGIVQGKVKIVADERTNILIVISRPPNFAFFDKIVAILDRPVDPEVIVRVLALEYAKADEIASILNEFIGAAKTESKTAVAGQIDPGEGRSAVLEDYVAQRAAAADRLRQMPAEEKTRIGQLSPNTKILADKRTNSLLLMGTKGDIAALEDVIDRLDTMLAQVIIEAVILEVGLTRGVEYGVDWLQRSMTAYNAQRAGPGGVLVREPVFAFGGGQRLVDSTYRDARTIDRADPGIGIGGLTYYTTFFDLNIDAILRMAASSSDAHILSTPVILTTDNTEAKIVVGEERPVVTTTTSGTTGQTSSYQYRSIGINLTVTPRINPQRFVVMEVSQTADNVGGFELIDGNRVPIITKREMQASIAVPSRGTVVLGGLVSTDRRMSRSKIPILGDIPILGTLFRYDARDNNRTELLVLLTPYVLMTPEEARQETVRLHQATRAGQGRWLRGWSDSRLAEPTSKQLREERRLEREEEKRTRSVGRDAARLETMKRDPSVPRISVVVPSEISLDDIRDVPYLPEDDEYDDEPYEPSSIEILVVPEREEGWSLEDVDESEEVPEFPAEPIAPEPFVVPEPLDAPEPRTLSVEDPFTPVPMSR